MAYTLPSSWSLILNEENQEQNSADMEEEIAPMVVTETSHDLI